MPVIHISGNDPLGLDAIETTHTSHSHGRRHGHHGHRAHHVHHSRHVRHTHHGHHDHHDHHDYIRHLRYFSGENPYGDFRSTLRQPSHRAIDSPEAEFTHSPSVEPRSIYTSNHGHGLHREQVQIMQSGVQRTIPGRTLFIDHEPIWAPGAWQIRRDNLRPCFDCHGAWHAWDPDDTIDTSDPCPADHSNCRRQRAGARGGGINNPFCDEHMRSYFGDAFADRSPEEILSDMADMVGMQWTGRPRARGDEPDSDPIAYSAPPSPLYELE
ncbi:hypothetical protein F4677DRAFT_366823 [Hypoxylon crocopeplum]|nr:hypothetical protein F4677DRAFT_366823 [Hypoxylon crocopeplum]